MADASEGREVVVDVAALIGERAETVARLIEADNHHWSPRPCPTCRAISGLLGRDFGCVARARRTPP